MTNHHDGPSWISPIPSGTLQILMQAGYLATGDGRLADARRIFAGIMAVRPSSELPWLGLAVAELSAGNTSSAKAALAQAKSLNPASRLVDDFFAIAEATQQSRPLALAATSQ